VVDADLVRVGEERVKIVEIDYNKNRITVEKPITWKAGAPVTLDYVGKGPDIGAFEFGSNPK
jgi:hypothetical protein